MPFQCPGAGEEIAVKCLGAGKDFEKMPRASPSRRSEHGMNRTVVRRNIVPFWLYVKRLLFHKTYAILYSFQHLIKQKLVAKQDIKLSQEILSIATKVKVNGKMSRLRFADREKWSL